MVIDARAVASEQPTEADKLAERMFILRTGLRCLLLLAAAAEKRGYIST